MAICNHCVFFSRLQLVCLASTMALKVLPWIQVQAGIWNSYVCMALPLVLLVVQHISAVVSNLRTGCTLSAQTDSSAATYSVKVCGNRDVQVQLVQLGAQLCTSLKLAPVSTWHFASHDHASVSDMPAHREIGVNPCKPASALFAIVHAFKRVNVNMCALPLPPPYRSFPSRQDSPFP